MNDFASASLVGWMLFMAVLMVVAWQYFGTEKKRNNFLEDRIRDYRTEENLKKSKRVEAIDNKLMYLESPYNATDLITKSYLIAGVIVFIGIIGNILPIAVLLAVGALRLPEIYCALRKDKLDKEFEKQLPDSIDSLLAIIQAGLTPAQGYKLLSEDAPFPSNKEFHRLYNDIKTGASQEQALTDFYNRHPINDIKLFMTGMIISAEASPLVAVSTLKTISSTIRTRASQKQSAKSAITQGKYTAIMLSLAPVIALAVMLTFMPDYIGPFVENDFGKIAIVFALILDAIGYGIASKITSAKSIVKY